MRDTKTGRFTKNGKPQLDPRLEMAMVQRLVENIAFSRQEVSRQLTNDPRRNIDDDCGFPTTESLTPEKYRHMYDRSAVAARAVEVLPVESWQVEPSVKETEDVDNETPFELAWKELPKTLSGPSWHTTEGEGNAVWEFLRRVDIQSGIGNYGVLLLGLDDGKELEKEAKMSKEGGPVKRKLLYLRVFDHSMAPVASYDTDKTSPRYGQPEIYNLTFDDPSISGAAKTTTVTEKVHWTRVLHIADNLTNSEVIGVPRQQPIFNNLLSLEKLYGGSAEMYWRGAFPGISIESHPQLRGDIVLTPAEKQAMKDAIEQYQNTLQRYLTLTGFTAKNLAPQVVDPSAQIEAQIDAICIRLGIPKRIFMGSERGELASGQDDETWNDRLRVRQRMYITPRIIVTFVDRLIMLGVLPPPAESYGVTWPDLSSPSEEGRALIAASVTEALAKYVGGGVEALIPALDFLVHVLHFDKPIAKEIIESAISQERMLEEEVPTILTEEKTPEGTTRKTTGPVPKKVEGAKRKGKEDGNAVPKKTRPNTASNKK